MSSSLDLHLDDGVEKRLPRKSGLSRPPGTWRTLTNYSRDAVCLTLASLPYEEADHIRSFTEFQRLSVERRTMYQ
jgi:hypothetical protein